MCFWTAIKTANCKLSAREQGRQRHKTMIIARGQIQKDFKFLKKREQKRPKREIEAAINFLGADFQEASTQIADI